MPIWDWSSVAALNRTFTGDDLKPLLDDCGIDKTVCVQAFNSYADTEFMLAQADVYDWIGAVVGWVPLTDPAEAARALDVFGAHPKFRGIRHLTHGESDPGWLLRDDVIAGCALLAERHLVLEVPSMYPMHTETVTGLAAAVPDLQIVIDHMAYPPFVTNDLSDWERVIREAGGRSNVAMKVSGLGTAVSRPDWSAEDTRPAVQIALEALGPDRLMFGSDWPVCLLAGEYKKMVDETAVALGDLDPASSDAVWGGTAAKVYRI